MTLGDVVERYLPYAERKLKASTYSGVVLHLRKHWRPLHAFELQNLERRHVAAELGRIATSSGLYGANRSRAALSALFAWAIGEGLTDTNPVVGTNKATEEVSRDRVLTSDELSLIWRHAGEGDYGAIVRLLILTGQRREEVGGILWSEIDLKAAMWRIASERTKNARPHEVPLSQPALDILGARARVDGRALVFGSRGPFSGWSKAKAALDARMAAELGQAPTPWRLHDIRRTVATGLADLGVQPHVIEAVLNHVSGHKAGHRRRLQPRELRKREAPVRSTSGPSMSPRWSRGGRSKSFRSQGAREDTMPHSWKSLRDARTTLEFKDGGRLRFAFYPDIGSAIACAIRSNDVPTRGRLSDSGFSRIERQLTDKAQVDCILNWIKIDGKRFEYVEVDIEALEKYMLENLVTPGIQLWDPTGPLVVKDTVERRLSEYLKAQQDGPAQRKEELFKAIMGGSHEASARPGEPKLSSSLSDLTPRLRPR